MDSTIKLNAEDPRAYLPPRPLFPAILVLWLLLFHPTALALDPTRSLNQFSYQTWQTGSGLPQNTVHSILQSRDGYVWLATEGGLVRFDGVQFTVFDTRNTPALKSDNIRSLVEDQEGSLWVATPEGVYVRRGGEFSNVSGHTGAAVSNVLALYRDHLARIWAIEPEGLEAWSIDPHKPAKAERLRWQEGSPRLTGAMAADINGTILVGSENGLRVSQNGRLRELTTNLPVGAVNALMPDRSSNLWVGTARGLFVAKPHELHRFEPVPVSFPGDAVLALFEDWEGSIWVGCRSGITRLVKDRDGRFQSERALSGQYVIAMAEDAEGDLWIGSESTGATIARNQKFVAYTTRDGLASDIVRCVFESHDGVLSVGTDAGLTQKEGNRYSQLTTREGLSSNIVLSMGNDREGRLNAGTPDGLNLVSRAGAVSVTTSADGLADDFVRSIYRDTDGSLWIGTRRGLSHEESPGRFATFTQADGLGSDLVGAVLRDHRGDLWVGTLNGLSRLHGRRFVTLRTHDGLSSNVVTDLYEDADGDLWVATQNGGLDVLVAGVCHPVPQQVGLPATIFGMSEDANGELWFSSKTGIARANRNELKKAALNRSNGATAIWYDTSDGLRINEASVGGHPEVWKAQDGTLWFSMLKGVAALYPSAARLNRVLPPVVIESVKIDDRLFEPFQVSAVKPGHSRFAFEYAGLSFVAPQKVLYRYKLDGFDKGWVEAGLQRIAYYTNIPPGAYRFRVAARNNDGFWNETGAVLSFRLEPHYYQTAWFYALVVFAFAALCYFIYRWRVAEVEARFQAVSEERNRIAREIHDTLAQGFVGVSMQLEIVSRLLSSSAEAAREHLDQARLQVRESLSEARRSIWQLRSQSSESEDLASRLSKSARQIIGSSPVKLSMEVRGTYRSLRSNVEDELLRIGQEAVTNALRHAEAASISIELVYAARKLRMTISDDGLGFSVGSFSSGPNGHFGLKGMRERAAQINANLVVDSAEGKGTRVSVEAPLN